MSKHNKNSNPSSKNKVDSPVSKATQTQPEAKTVISPDQKMKQTISQFDGLQEYEIRDLVKHSEELGKHLVDCGLKTNQIRKFLDEINRLKVQLSQSEDKNFSSIKDEIFMLKPQLAWATARQKTKYGNPVQPFSDVVSIAIEKVKKSSDFYRLVQLSQSIIAYHKAAGGKDN